MQETCLISAVTSGPTEPKTSQEAWHCGMKKKDIIGELPSGRECEVWLTEDSGEKQKEKRNPMTED